MSRGDREQSLRRLVADLATQPRSEVLAVLESLAPPNRDTVEAMLARCTNPDGGYRFEGLSPWIVDRLTTGSASLTPHAATILRECARTLAPTKSGGSASHSPSLLTRLASGLSRKGAQ